MEPQFQVEIQLGHLCNNRCVFCVSGQLTAQRKARAIPASPVIAELERARASGAQRVTLLGGEPTIQRSFVEVLEHAKRLGYEEIVIFTNGVMTARPEFLRRVLELGDFTWRFSIQGATAAHHDAVTKRPGSFERIATSMRALRERGQRLTANMCITHENLESLPHYPALVAEHGLSQLHLDQIRPGDAGERDDAYLAQIMPRYSDQVPWLRAMLSGFGAEVDVNVGNFPYCLLPEHAHRIHHDGQATQTIAATENKLTAPFDKYATKRADKTHPPACRGCAFEQRCNGLFETYQRIFGSDEIRAISRESLWDLGGAERHLPLLLEPARHALAQSTPPEPWVLKNERAHEPLGWVEFEFAAPGAMALFRATPLSAHPIGRADGFAIEEVRGLHEHPEAVAELGGWLLQTLAALSGRDVVQPPRVAAIARRGHTIARCLQRLGVLQRRWPHARLERIVEGARLSAPIGEEVVTLEWMVDSSGIARLRYSPPNTAGAFECLRNWVAMLQGGRASAPAYGDLLG